VPLLQLQLGQTELALPNTQHFHSTESRKARQ
jgi:hypothetical protein